VNSDIKMTRSKKSDSKSKKVKTVKDSSENYYGSDELHEEVFVNQFTDESAAQSTFFENPTNGNHETDEATAAQPDPGKNTKFLKDSDLSGSESDGFELHKSKKRKRKEKRNADKHTEPKPKKPTNNAVPTRLTAAESFIRESDELEQIMSDEELDPDIIENNMDIELTENDNKFFKPSENSKYFDLFITNISEDKRDEKEYTPKLGKIISDGIASLGITRKFLYSFHKTKNPGTIRIKVSTPTEHVLLQKVFSKEEYQHPLGPDSKCEIASYLLSESNSGNNHKRPEPVWLVLKGVPRNYSRQELKDTCTTQDFHPITFLRLKNASNEYLSTVKVLYPAEEAAKLIQNGSQSLSHPPTCFHSYIWDCVCAILSKFSLFPRPLSPPHLSPATRQYLQS